MRKKVFGQAVSAADIEELRPDSGPTDFVRLCGAVIAAELRDRTGLLTLPEITERILVPDGGVDAQYTTPEVEPWPETHGLIGPGKTIFQFKYRDIRRSDRRSLLREITRRLRAEFPRAAPFSDRYVLLTNLDLSHSERASLRKALLDSVSGFGTRP